MLRLTAFLLGLCALSSAAFPANEADRRGCAAQQTPDAAIEACTHVLDDKAAQASERLMAYRNRGIAYAGKALPDLAILDFSAALKLDAHDRTALAGRARNYARKGQYDHGIADFNEVLKIDPRSERTLNERGLLYLRTGDLDAAQADFEAALRLSPANAHPLNNRALVLARKGKLDEAITGFNEVLRIDPGYLLAYANRARVYEAKGDTARALADFKSAAEGTPRPKMEEEARVKKTAQRQVARLTAALADSKATAKPPAEKRVALVIGNSAYQHAPALRNPANDAKALAAALHTIGFVEVGEVYDGDLATISRALKDFGDLAEGADWAVIYFAGHGLEVGGINYLVPVDAKLEQQSHVEDEAVPLSRLMSKVLGASKLQLVILDACRNNPFLASMRGSGRATRAITQGLTSIEPESGVLVAYSAKDGTTAMDGDSRNSPYAESLAKRIVEPGLEISLLFRKVRDDVLSTTGRQQEPYTYGSLPAEPFYFKR